MTTSDTQPTPSEKPREAPYSVLFSIPFHAELTARMTALLQSQLDMTFTLEPKMGVAPQALGFARIDFSTGLVLVRKSDDEWEIECRSYRNPPADLARLWELRTAGVLRMIDPGVEAPARRSPAAG